MPAETELKLEVPDAQLDAIADLPWLKKLQAGPAKTAKLVSVYFDTSKETLRQHHFGLRLRHCDGTRLQTVKSGASSVERQEWESEISGMLPERKLARHTAMRPLASKRRWRKLGPLFETEIERTSIPLRVQGAVIALALDRGKVKAQGKALGVSEVELELKEGGLAAVADLARHLAENTAITLSLQSKAERGYGLVHDDIGAAVKAPELCLNPGQNTADAFRAIVLSCLEHVTANRAAVLNGDAEGVHQMRVALRRLRAALSLFKAMLGDPESEKIRHDLKRLGERLGPARDLDVFLAKTIAPLQHQERRIPLKSLKRELALGRDRGIGEARRMAAGEAYRSTVLETGLWALAGNWTRWPDQMCRARGQRPIADTAQEILERRSKKILKKLKRLDGMDSRARHKLRIAVKKLRYATGFFAALYEGAKRGKRVRAFQRRLKELQRALGRLNDIKVHEDYACRELDKTDGKDGSRLFGLGFVTGNEKRTIARCLAQTAKAGKRFARQGVYWT